MSMFNFKKESKNEKVLTFIAWIIVWVILFSVYFFAFWPHGNKWWNIWSKWWMNRWNFGQQGQMDDAWLEKMAQRVWITKEELKKEIDSGKSIRDIMKEKSVQMWWSRWLSWSRN